MPTGKRYKDSTKPTLTWKWKAKHNNVKLDGLDQNIIGYLNTLESKYQNLILATSGKGGKHAKHSRHFSGSAVDLRVHNKKNPLEDDLYKRIYKDPVRLQYGITLLDPRHGTASHLHLSTGEGSENLKDVWLHPNTTEADKVLKKNNILPTTYIPFDNSGRINEVSAPESFSQEIGSLIQVNKEEGVARNQVAKTVDYKANVQKRIQERQFLSALINDLGVDFVERKK